ncbi:MAG: ribbon-helix-helix protein, CopG family [Armatimonadetes bacterium]|nr:ribbon-helix-helix protein, CopG family [Armatimonadota bacterium]
MDTVVTGVAVSASVHYNSHMSVSKTFRLSEETARALEDLVAAGRAPNQTALIEELIRRERLRLRIAEEEAELDRQWQEAMADPAFREEQADIHDEFALADEEIWAGL